MRKVRLFLGWCAVHTIAIPLIFFFLIDRAGHGLIAISTWAAGRREWSEAMFRVLDRIEMWARRES